MNYLKPEYTSWLEEKRQKQTRNDLLQVMLYISDRSKCKHRTWELFTRPECLSDTKLILDQVNRSTRTIGD